MSLWEKSQGTRMFKSSQLSRKNSQSSTNVRLKPKMDLPFESISTTKTWMQARRKWLSLNAKSVQMTTLQMMTKRWNHTRGQMNKGKAVAQTSTWLGYSETKEKVAHFASACYTWFRDNFQSSGRNSLNRLSNSRNSQMAELKTAISIMHSCWRKTDSFNTKDASLSCPWCGWWTSRQALLTKNARL